MPRKITILFRFSNLGEDKSLILCISLVTVLMTPFFVSNFANLNFLSALVKLAKGLPILLIFSKNSSFHLFFLLCCCCYCYCFSVSILLISGPTFVFLSICFFWVLSFCSRNFVSCVFH